MSGKLADFPRVDVFTQVKKNSFYVKLSMS